MKKTIIFALFVIFAATLFSCGEAGSAEQLPEKAHVCEFGEWEIVTEPTCTSVGQRTRYCSGCGNSQSADVAPSAHTVAILEGYAADCENDGLTDGTYCEVCYETLREQQPIYSGGHSFNEREVIPATCTENGAFTAVKCSECGYVRDAEVVISATGHNYRTETVLPTCTSEGYEKHTCRECEYSFTNNYTQKLSHSVARLEAVAPTCITAGYTEGSYCTVCSEIIVAQTPILATGHTEKIISAVSPTCDTVGYTEGAVCSICDATVKAATEIPKLLHNYTDTVILPTCEAGGYTEHKCSLCQDTYNDTYTEKLKHTETVIPGYPATCTASGMTDGKYCVVCENVTKEQEIIVAKGHTEESVVGKLPTCTEGGITAKISCSACGEVLLRDVVTAPLGHEYAENVINPTCTEGGHTEHTCIRCGDSYTDSFTQKKGHNTKIIPYSAPTCTVDGATEGSYCEDCGITFTESTPISAKGHVERELPSLAPTCHTTGLSAGVDCSICGTVIEKQNTIARLEHIYTSESITPTCTEGGYTISYCSRCGHSYKSGEVGAIGHLVQTIVGKNATCTESGLTDGKKCSICNLTIKEQEFIAAKGHTSVTVPATAATCLESGLTDGAYCSTCSAVITPQTVVSPKGHTEKVIPAVAPTCNNGGSTEGKICSVCEAVLVVSEPIASTGHVFMPNVVLPTCTEGGYTRYECSCGYGYQTDSVTKLGHKMTAWHFDESLAKGVRSCERCDFYYGTSSMTAEYVGTYHPFVGEGVPKNMIAVTVVHDSNGYEESITDFEILKTVLDTPGTDFVTVKFFEREVVVAIPTLYANLPGASPVAHFTYTENKNGEVTITGYTGPFTDIVIPSCIARNKPVVAIAQKAFQSNTKITSVAIPGSVKTIGYYAFQNCTSLEEITLHEGIGSIAYGAFMNTAVKEIVLPDSLTVMSSDGGTYYYGAFESCSQLTSVTIGASLAKITPESFNNCISLKTVTFTGETSVIDEYAFSGCIALTDILFNEGLTSINKGAFKGCTSLVTVNFPTTLTTIGESAFANDTALTNVNFNDGLVTIGNKAFEYCSAIETVTTPASLQTISYYAFRYCDGLATLNLTEGLKTIDYGAFLSCDALLSVRLPDSLTVMNSDGGAFYYGAFAGCSQLTSVTIGASLAKITPESFNNCISLKTVTFTGETSVIDEYAFSGCIALTDILFNEGLTSINKGAFGGCTSLVIVNFPTTLTTIGESAFANDTALKRVSFNDGLVTIGNKAFEYCSAIETVTTPASLQTIGSYAFRYCDGLLTLNLTEGLKTIGYGAFLSCDALLSVILPDSLTAMNSDGGSYYSGAFEGCKSLKYVVVGNALATITSHSFDSCTALHTVVFGENVTTIETHAFSDCHSLSSIDFGGNLRTIGNYAFQNCRALETLILPSTVQTVGNYAFAGCNSLEIVSMSGVQTVGSYAFSNCEKLDTVTIAGTRLASVGSGAFNNCKQLKRIYYGGDAEEWASVEIAEKNTYPLDVTPYYYSETEPTTDGNFWYFGKDKNELVWQISEKQYLADHYTSEFATELCGPEKSLIGEYQQELLTFDFVSMVTLWETMHIISQPSHAFEGGYISREAMYQMIIYEIIGMGEVSIFSEMIASETKTYYDAIKSVLDKANIGDLNNPDAKQTLGDDPLWNDMSDVVETCFVLWENGEEAINNLAKYRALVEVSEHFYAVLMAISNDTDIDRDIRNAAKGVAEIMSKTSEEAIDELVNKHLFWDTAEDFALMALDVVWDKLVLEQLGLGAVMKGIRGFRMVVNSFSDKDEVVANYIMMDVAYKLQGAIRKVVVNSVIDPMRYENQGEEDFILKASGMLEAAMLAGYDYAYDFAVSHNDSQKAYVIVWQKMIYENELEGYHNTATSNYHKYYQI